MFDLSAELMKLRELAQDAGAGAGAGGVGIGIGTLIGVTDIGPLTVEVRVGATIDGDACWLYRMDDGGGGWIEAPLSTGMEFECIRRLLAEAMPLHVVVWWERDGEWDWQDA